MTKFNSYPLPLIDDILALLAGSKYFTTLDLKYSYWQVLVQEKDKEKTAFTCQRGLFEFNVMPLGLRTAPQVFQELMVIVLEGLEHFSMAYLDDVLIHSETLESHYEHIQNVFDRLKEHGLKLKLKKCSFLKETTSYLGFTISPDGVSPYSSKISSIRSLPTPSTVREVRSFHGMCSYYRRFIPRFSEIAIALINLTKKYAKLKWTDESQQTFDHLKQNLTCLPNFRISRH